MISSESKSQEQNPFVSDDDAAQLKLAIQIINKKADLKGFDAALNCIRLAAKKGQPDAQYELGKFFRSAGGLDQDDVNALKWLRLAADKKHAGAQWLLGLYYQEGRGVDKNLPLAIDYFIKAAEGGACESQIFLGKAYRDGDEILLKKDEKSSAHWYLKAAEQGNDWAQFWIGMAYCQGKGVDENLAEGRKWLTKSVALDDYYDSYRSPEYKAKFNDLLLKAEKGDAEAQVDLYLAYKHGLGTGVNLTEGEKWLVKASEANNPKACFRLGKILYFKNSANFSVQSTWQDNGIKLLKKSSDLGYMPAILEYLRLSDIDRKDVEKSINEFLVKYDNGDPEIQFYLSFFFRNPEKQIWILKSAKQGYLPAVHRLESISILKKHADLGDVLSQSRLRYLYFKNREDELGQKYLLMAANGGSYSDQLLIAYYENQKFRKKPDIKSHEIAAKWARIACCTRLGIFSSPEELISDQLKTELKQIEEVLIEAGR